jgi:hypothetical protein
MLCRLVIVLAFAAFAGGCGFDAMGRSRSNAPDPAASVSASLPGHAYMFAGPLGGFPRGLDQLTDKINRGGLSATMHGSSESGALAAEIVRKYQAGEDRGPVILVGHSNGVDVLIAVARQLVAAEIPIALAVAYGAGHSDLDVPADVELFINLYQSDSPSGGTEARAGAGFRGRLINVDLREHSEIANLSLDRIPALQDIVAAKILAVAAYHAAQATAPPRAKRPERNTVGRPLVMKYAVPRDEPIVLWDSAIEMRVKRGDTLESIASSYGAPAWAIEQINGLAPDRPIESRRTLLIPRGEYTDQGDAPVPPVAQQRAPAATRTSSARPPGANASSFGERWGSQTGQ